MIAYRPIEKIMIKQHIKIPHCVQLTESESIRAGVRKMKATELQIRQQMTIMVRVSIK